MKKQLIPPIIVILLTAMNLLSMEATSDLKPILFTTILAMGMGLGVLLKVLFDYVKRKGN